MPNKPRASNPARPVRVEDELWNRVKAIAEKQGVKPSEIVRRAIRAYVQTPWDNPEHDPLADMRSYGPQKRHG